MAIDVCPRCQGMWLDSGELQHFPNRAALRPYLASAKQAPSRCRKQGHSIPRAMVACATCRGAPVACPSCGARLALVVTSTCTIDVCTACEGVWLDAGELEQLHNVAAPSRPAAKPRSAPASEWEVAEATDTGGDPWKGAGSFRPLPVAAVAAPPPVVSRSPFGCNHCGITVMAHQAYAYDGEIYCETCKPAGAVSGAKAPKDRPIFAQDLDEEEDVGVRLFSWVVALFR